MTATGSACVHMSADAPRAGAWGVDGRIGLPKGDTLCLRAALAVVLAEHTVSPHLFNCIFEQVKVVWNYEVTVYRSTHPDFQSPSVPGRNGRLQRVLPVHEALLLAPRLVAIGLRRVHQELLQAWVDLQLEGDLAAAIEGEINEEE